MNSADAVAEAELRLAQAITAREQLEVQLRLAQDQTRRALDELDQFAYITSHDLQAPLRNVAGFSQLLSRRYAAQLDADGREFLQFIEQGVGEMQGLVRGLLALSRIGRGDEPAERLPLLEPLQTALAALDPVIRQSAAHIQIGPLPVVMARASLMVQLFQNLVGNALKFRQPQVAPVVRISALRSGASWQLRVADNGIGIAHEQLEHIFAVFRRLHGGEAYQGSGMGLALCRKIAHQHGGRIWAESDGTGATFLLELPA